MLAKLCDHLPALVIRGVTFFPPDTSRERTDIPPKLLAFFITGRTVRFGINSSCWFSSFEITAIGRSAFAAEGYNIVFSYNLMHNILI